MQRPVADHAASPVALTPPLAVAPQPVAAVRMQRASRLRGEGGVAGGALLPCGEEGVAAPGEG